MTFNCTRVPNRTAAGQAGTTELLGCHFALGLSPLICPRRRNTFFLSFPPQRTSVFEPLVVSLYAAAAPMGVQTGSNSAVLRYPWSVWIYILYTKELCRTFCIACLRSNISNYTPDRARPCRASHHCGCFLYILSTGRLAMFGGGTIAKVFMRVYIVCTLNLPGPLSFP